MNIHWGLTSEQVLMLSEFGSRCRLMQAHMCPVTQRLQLRYSEFYDFRNLTQYWLDIFVRWFLNDPLPVPIPRDRVEIPLVVPDLEPLDEVLEDRPADIDSEPIESSQDRCAVYSRHPLRISRKSHPALICTFPCRAEYSTYQTPSPSPQIPLSAK
jgi:hypothetical protein